MANDSIELGRIRSKVLKLEDKVDNLEISSSNANNINGNLNITGNLEFARSPEAKILFNSDINYGSDKAFILYKQDSAYHVNASNENSRLSIGVYNDNENAVGEGLDLQGAASLIFNVGQWDSELNNIIGGQYNNVLPSAPIKFRINNDTVAAFSSSGRLQVGTDSDLGSSFYGGLSAANKFAVYGDADIVKFGNVPALGQRYARGSAGNPTSVNDGDRIGANFYGGYHSNLNAGNGGWINPCLIASYVDGDTSTTSTAIPGKLSFFTTQINGSRTENLTIKSNGNVGVGLTNPGFKLSIAGSTDQYPALLGIYETSHPSSRRAGIQFGNNWVIGQDAAGDGDRNFFFYNGGTGDTPLFISSDNKIGIGTTGPDSKLHVQGGGLAIGPDAIAISSVHGGKNSIQIATDNYYGGIYDDHTGMLIYSTMPGGWGTSQLEFRHSTNWGTYASSPDMVIGENVGIGTTSPGAKLDVSGNIRGYTGAQYSGLYLQKDTTNAIAKIYGSATNNDNGVFQLLTNNIPTVQLASTGFSNFIASGNVGIGTISPVTKINIATTVGNDGIELDGNSNLWSSFRINMGAGSYNNITANNDRGIIYGSNVPGSPGGGFVIAPWATGPSGLRMDANGNVGIGITNPDAELDILGSAQSTSLVDRYVLNVNASDSFNGDGGSTVYSNSIKLKAGDLTWNSNTVRSRGSEIYIGGGYSINAAVNNSEIKMSTAGAERLRISGIGNVGIGNTNPSYKLDVAGDIYTSTNVVLTNTGGITFGTTAGGTGTRSSNTLSDYEEGSWTPTSSGAGFTVGTIFTNSNRYLKIGNLIFVTAYVQITGTGTGGVFSISGLPFTSGTSTGAGNIGIFNKSGWTIGLHCYVAGGATSITFAKMSNGLTSLLGTDLGTGPINIQFNAVYSTI